MVEQWVLFKKGHGNILKTDLILEEQYLNPALVEVLCLLSCYLLLLLLEERSAGLFKAFSAWCENPSVFLCRLSADCPPDSHTVVWGEEKYRSPRSSSDRYVCTNLKRVQKRKVRK